MVPLFNTGGILVDLWGCLRIARFADRVSGVKITNFRSPNNCRYPHPSPVLSRGGIAVQPAQTVGCEGPDQKKRRDMADFDERLGRSGTS